MGTTEKIPHSRKTQKLPYQILPLVEFIKLFNGLLDFLCGDPDGGDCTLQDSKNGKGVLPHTCCPRYGVTCGVKP
jgi:hypothetical protein